MKLRLNENRARHLKGQDNMFRILIVDDTKSVHSYVKMILAKLNGISVVSVFDGEQALALLKNSTDFDLIFLDWEMPNMNGPQTLMQFRTIQLHIPIIMLTSKNEAEEIEQVLRLGASEYVMKPFTFDILLEKMQFVTGKEFAYAS